MIGVNESGIRAVKGDRPGRFDKFSPSLDELTGLGPEADRDGAIIVLSISHGWSPARLSILFGISEPQVRRVVADFKAEYEESL